MTWVDLYDGVRKFFITLSPVPDMDYVLTNDKSDDESNNEQPDTTDTSDLGSEESAEQEAKGLKIFTPQQMLSRLPISLAQLKPGNTSEKLKNEIRELLYSL